MTAASAANRLDIFDMLDYGLLFDQQAQNVHVPEFDKLRNESYFARNAMSPNQWTQEPFQQ